MDTDKNPSPPPPSDFDAASWPSPLPKGRGGIAASASARLGSRSLNPLGFEVRLQGGRHNHAAIRLLARLDQRHKQTCQGRAAAVQNVREFILATLGLESQIHAARL